MRFPTAITVKTVDAASKAPIPHLAIVLTLFARKKNDYQVGPFVTNETGEVTFSCDDCERCIRRAQEMFVMDYSGTIEDCGSRVTISLWPPEYLARMIENYECAPNFWGQAFDDPPKVFRELRTVRNLEFEPSSVEIDEHRVLLNPYVVFPLRRKDVAPGTPNPAFGISVTGP